MWGLSGIERPTQGRKSQEPAYPVKKNRKKLHPGKTSSCKKVGNCQPHGNGVRFLKKAGNSQPHGNGVRTGTVSGFNMAGTVTVTVAGTVSGFQKSRGTANLTGMVSGFRKKAGKLPTSCERFPRL
jgi:hypothetical protein